MDATPLMKYFFCIYLKSNVFTHLQKVYNFRNSQLSLKVDTMRNQKTFERSFKANSKTLEPILALTLSG